MGKISQATLDFKKNTPKLSAGIEKAGIEQWGSDEVFGP
jgi:hypothetical protein